MVGISQDKGRDTTAICQQECTIFVMPISEIIKIKQIFTDVYTEMLQMAIKRHNNHKVLIAREVKNYIQKVKDSDLDDSSEMMSEEVIAESMLNSDHHSPRYIASNHD